MYLPTWPLSAVFAVVEHVVDDAKPRRHVAPVRQVLDLVELARRDEPARRRALRRHVGVERLEADAGVERQPLVGRSESCM